MKEIECGLMNAGISFIFIAVFSLSLFAGFGLSFDAEKLKPPGSLTLSPHQIRKLKNKLNLPALIEVSWLRWKLGIVSNSLKRKKRRREQPTHSIIKHLLSLVFALPALNEFPLQFSV